MNKTQKSAWFGLTMSTLLLVLLVTSVLVARRVSQLSNLLWFSPAFGLFALLIIFLRKKDQDRVNIDERDSCISRKALIAAFSSTAGLLIGACMIPPFIAGPTNSIPVCLLPALLYSLFVVFILTYSMAILIQYGWRDKNGK
jgi:hypothetical protein